MMPLLKAIIVMDIEIWYVFYIIINYTIMTVNDNQLLFGLCSEQLHVPSA